MKTDKIQELYNSSYAQSYDGRFLHSASFNENAKFELDLLRMLMPVSHTWLDVACGTGYFLSQFEGTKRAGIDLSPEMLNQARSHNPDALFFEERDFRQENKKFDNQWSLVSSMWGAYCYVEAVSEVEQFIANISAWTAEDGVCFLPVLGFEDLFFGGHDLPIYNDYKPLLGGPIRMDAVVWSYFDSVHNKNHENLISTHTDYIKEQLEKYFVRVDKIYYPPNGKRKALIATGKNGIVSAKVEEILERIKVESEKCKKVNPAAEGQKNAPESNWHPKAGWLRSLWKSLPLSARNIIRRTIGEK